MESTTPIVTLGRRRTIRSTSESVNHKSASQEEDALIFFSSLNSQSTLEYMTTFSRVENPWGYHLNNPFSFLEGFPSLGVPSPCFLIIGLSSNSRRCSHTQKKIASCSTISYSEQVYFFFFSGKF